MRHTILVRFKDGSGWLFATTGGGMWTVRDVRNGRPIGTAAYIPNDRRLGLLQIALDANDTTIKMGG